MSKSGSWENGVARDQVGLENGMLVRSQFSKLNRLYVHAVWRRMSVLL